MVKRKWDGIYENVIVEDKVEDRLFINRMVELANRAYSQNTFSFTGFLDMTQVSQLHQCKKELGNVTVTLYGGTKGCERQIARFGDATELGYDMSFPIACIHIAPLIKKFADELTHRDFLGAVMNLGIEREIIGDIMVVEKECYLFCVENMKEYLLENLAKIKHTHVKCQVLEEIPEVIQPKFEIVELLVSSERIDGVLSKIYNLSRSQSTELFREKKIFVNGKQCENNTYIIKKDDTISARGFGKTIYDGIISQTKKSKLRVQFRHYR